jgi:hypothetical protein
MKMNKTILPIFVVVLMCITGFASAIPVISPEDFPVSVNFDESSGGPDNNLAPVIKAKFEVSQGMMGYEHDPFYIDDDLTLAGTQVDPPMVFDGTTWVGYYAFVFDPNGNQEIEVVHADVWHPAETFPYNPLGEDEWFKYDLWLYALDDDTIDNIFLPYLYAVHDAEQGGLNPIICYNVGYDWTDLITQLLNGQIKVYYTHKELHYCQPAGYYRVDLYAFDEHGAYSMLTNFFEYVIGVGIETDFSGLDFGDAKLSVWKWIFGDWDFGIGDPTIRSIGNWDNRILLEFDHLGMGSGDEGGEERWNVVFDVRLAETFGPNKNRSYVEKHTDLFPAEPDEYYHSIWPHQQVVLPCDWDPRGLYPTGPNDIIEDDYFAKCNTSKISFGIHIRKPITYDLYTGFLTIEVEPPHIYDFMPDLPCGIV